MHRKTTQQKPRISSHIPATNIDQSKNITFSENRHIEKVIFSNISINNSQTNNRSSFTIFAGLPEWVDIPNFVLITGANGSGKSQLLEYIYNNARNSNRNHSTEEIIYVNASEQFSNYSSGNSQYDTSYHIISEHGHKDLINQVQNYLQTKVEPTSVQAKKMIKQIEKDLNDNKLAKESINQKYLSSIAEKIIAYEANELRLKEPLTFLGYIFGEYEKRKQTIINHKLNSIEGSLRLYDYYNSLNESELNTLAEQSEISNNIAGLDLRSLIELFTDNKNFARQLTNLYINNHLGVSPVEEVNNILSKYGFKYTLNVKFNNHHNKFELTFKKGELSIQSDALSSGEIMILGMMSWLFYVYGLSSTGEEKHEKLDNKVKIMLLDEPDKHLDPKLCKIFYKIVHEEFVEKQKIQVIMTTHRLDTVLLAPDNNIYLMNYGNNSIERVHKLQALFRMSSNLRDLLDYHHKVYTESVNDAKFYEGVYHSLKELCDNLREQQLTNKLKDYTWQITPDIRVRLLSNRYQLSFYSVSESQNKKIKSTKKYYSLELKHEQIPHDNEVEDNKIYLYIDGKEIKYKALNHKGKLENKVIKFDSKDGDYYKTVESTLKKDLSGQQLDDLITRAIYRAAKKTPFPLENNQGNVPPENNQGNGGCSKVITSINTDMTALKNLHEGTMIKVGPKETAGRWKKTRKIFSNTELYQSFGILDNDYGKDYKLGALEKFTVILERHSIENYLLDPIIFCSVLTIEEITLFIESRPLSQNEKNNLNLNESQAASKKLIAACIQIKNMLTQSKYDGLQESLDIYFQVIFNKIYGNYMAPPEHKRKPDGKTTYEKIGKKLNNEVFTSEQEVIFIVNINKTFSVKYPAEFLEVRGHDIEDFFYEKHYVADKIASRIYQNKLAYVPLDLAEVFFKLNEKVKTNVCAVIKPDRNEATPQSNKLDEYGNQPFFKKVDKNPMDAAIDNEQLEIQKNYNKRKTELEEEEINQQVLITAKFEDNDKEYEIDERLSSDEESDEDRNYSLRLPKCQ